MVAKLIYNHMNREYAIKLIHSECSGIKDELVSKISSEMYEDFCLLGFILQGVNDVGERTWKITECGKKQFDFYREPTLDEQKMGIYLASIGF